MADPILSDEESGAAVRVNPSETGWLQIAVLMGSSGGGLIQAAAGRASGRGDLRTKRSGWAR